MTKTIEVEFLPGDEVEVVMRYYRESPGRGVHKISKVIKAAGMPVYHLEGYGYPFTASDLRAIPKKPGFMIGDVVRSKYGRSVKIRDINKLPNSRDIYLCEALGPSDAQTSYYYAEELELIAE